MDEHINNHVIVNLIDSNNIWKKQVSKSLYDYIYSIDENFWKEIEIEAKLGHVLFQGKCEEKYSKIINPFLLSGKFRNSKDNFITFDSGLNNEDFFTLFEEISREFACKKEKINGPINSIDYDGNGFRKSIINDNVIEVIKKKNKCNYDIRNCGTDIRVSISREKKYDKDKSIRLSGYMREKHRISFYYESFVLDFTIVKSYFNKIFKSIRFEVELEFFKIRENASIYKENYRDFEKVIFEFCQKVQDFYSIIKINKINSENIKNQMKKFNFDFEN